MEQLAHGWRFLSRPIRKQTRPIGVTWWVAAGRPMGCLPVVSTIGLAAIVNDSIGIQSALVLLATFSVNLGGNLLNDALDHKVEDEGAYRNRYHVNALSRVSRSQVLWAALGLTAVGVPILYMVVDTQALRTAFGVMLWASIYSFTKRCYLSEVHQGVQGGLLWCFAHQAINAPQGWSNIWCIALPAFILTFGVHGDKPSTPLRLVPALIGERATRCVLASCVCASALLAVRDASVGAVGWFVAFGTLRPPLRKLFEPKRTVLHFTSVGLWWMYTVFLAIAVSHYIPGLNECLRVLVELPSYSLRY